MKDYYKVLGVEKDATAAAIKAAFRKLAKENHPDYHPGNKAAETRFKVLLDTQKLWGSGPRNIVRLFLSPDGLRPMIEDWERVAQWVMEQVYRQAHEGIGDPPSHRLFNEYLDIPGVREVWKVPPPDYVYPQVLHLTVKKFGLRLANFFIMTTFGT